MATGHKMSKVAALSPQQITMYYRCCVDTKRDASEVYDSLMTLLEELRSCIVLKELDRLQEAMNAAKGLSDMLLKAAREKQALRYVYFGLYQAYLEQFQNELMDVRADRERQEAIDKKTKHFSEIMRFIYDNDTAQHKEIARQLGIEKGNLTREIGVLVDIGYVEKIPVGRCQYYTLTPRGYEYVRQHLRSKTHPGFIFQREATVIPYPNISSPQGEVDYYEALPSSVTGKRLAAWAHLGSEGSSLLEFSWLDGLGGKVHKPIQEFDIGLCVDLPDTTQPEMVLTWK